MDTQMGAHSGAVCKMYVFFWGVGAVFICVPRGWRWHVLGPLHGLGFGFVICMIMCYKWTGMGYPKQGATCAMRHATTCGYTCETCMPW